MAIGLGSGAESRAPMGTATVGGMVTSTLLTLVIIPVVYSLMDDVSRITRRLLFGGEKAAAPAPAAEEQVDSESAPLSREVSPQPVVEEELVV